MHFLDYDPDDIDVRVAQLLTATVDVADPLLHPKVSEALSVLREHLDMDVVFVSQFHDHKRTFRVVEQRGDVAVLKTGHSDPAEESWCHYIAEGRAPQLMKDAAPYVADGTVPDPGIAIGTHISAPVILANGDVYGTLCCFSRDVKEGISEMDLRRLQYTAQLLSEELLDSGLGAELELEPEEGTDAAPRKGKRHDVEPPRFGAADFGATEKVDPVRRDFQPTERHPTRDKK